MENLAATIGKNISSLRKAKGLTQLELASEIHYSDKSISKWELGYTCPSIDILMDFASYFGVSVDYLTQEHEPESAEKVIHADEKKDPQAINKALIIAMTTMFVVLVAVSVFLSEYYFRNMRSLELFAVFLWMIPISLFLIAIETRRFYHNKVATFVVVSCFLWSLLLCFCFHFAFFSPQTEQLWFILIVGAPLQVILALLFSWRKKPKAETASPKEVSKDVPMENPEK